MQEQQITEFIDFASRLQGDEKGEAQTFCDRLFRLFGHSGFREAGGIFEARVKFSQGNTKFIDALWSPLNHSGVLIEMKKRSEKNLEKHFSQAMTYWCQMNPQTIVGPGAQKPKYIMLCNFDRIIIYDHLLKVDDLAVAELSSRWTALNFLLPDEREPIFQNNTRTISEEAARHIGELFKHLVYDLKYDREKSRRFVLQCVVALFSEDVGLLPKDFFLELILDCRRRPLESFDLIGGLFRQMASKSSAPGGRFKNVSFFNGGIFDTVEPLELDLASLNWLEQASRQDWRSVNPAIFGGLFEGTMSKDSRHEFGAHFTHADDIYKVIYPTIISPWNERIEQSDTLAKLTATRNDLSQFRVLDPACGCGNFLFMAFQALKELELKIVEKIAKKYSAKKTKNLNLGVSQVTTKQFYGLDILPMAVELTKVTMMIAKEIAAEKWNQHIQEYDNALNLSYENSLPLDNLDANILCQDAVLEPWPEFDCVIGNPPYQSKNKMAVEMDNAYIARMRRMFPDVPRNADYCVYWFRKAHELLKTGQRAGMVGTNTIRQNYSRQGGLDYIVQNGGTITDAVSTQKWPGEAAVSVSIVNWIKGAYDSEKTLRIQQGDSLESEFETFHPETINSSLSLHYDVASAKKLNVNSISQCCFVGQLHGVAGFLVDLEQGKTLLNIHPEYSDVLFLFLNGDDLIGQKDSTPTRYVIDFRKHDIFSAKKYTELFNIVQRQVYPVKKEKAKEQAKKNSITLSKEPKAELSTDHIVAFDTWWRFRRPRNELMNILETIPRYIGCSRVMKRPIFEFIVPSIHPSDAMVVFPLADNYSFGILQSSVHWAWFQARCSTLGNQFRYTSNTVFDSFPWPQKPTEANINAVAQSARALVIKRREVMTQYNYSLRDLYRLTELSPQNPVAECQAILDEAVCRAYGMKRKANALEFLLDLNQTLYEKEQSGAFVRGPGFPVDIIPDPAPFITSEAVGK